MAFAAASVNLPIPLVEPVTESRTQRREARPTENSSFDGQWRISGKPFLDSKLEIPTLSQVLQQLPIRSHRIRTAPNMGEYPLLESQAEAFMGALDRERSSMRRSSQLRCCTSGVFLEDENRGRSRYRPDLVLPDDPQRRLLWLSESARSYGRAPQQPCHLPACYHPAQRAFSTSGYAGKRQRAGLSTVVTRSRVHKSLELFGGI